jgi:SNF2 family DNA or RNA helicase
MLSYKHKTLPFAHQIEALNRCVSAPYYGLLMEQRTGKSKVVIDAAAIAHSKGRINALLIIAPNGVHRNWANIEVPRHMPDWVERYTTFWSAEQTKKRTTALEELFAPGHHLRILSMNIEALTTRRGAEFARRFLNATDAMMVVDESTRIKNPTAACTKAVLKLRDQAKMRMILNGTPITQSPLDMYAQLLFLDEYAVPVQSWVAFRARYADFLPASHPVVQSIMRKSGTRWAPQIIATNKDGSPAYKNIEELKEWVDRCCYRVLRKDCSDMPEKLYKRWEVVMPPEQRKIIDEHLSNMKNGHVPEPINKLEAVLYYQQMLCGMVPAKLTGGDALNIFAKPEDNPRIQALFEIIDDNPDASILIWARFKKDLHEISQAIETRYNAPVARYWGDINDEDRELAVSSFQAKVVRYFVGQQGAGGVGLTLSAADVMVYHSNDFSLYHRLQSEDRAEGLQKKTGTLIVDLAAPGTVDDKIISALRDKKDIADLITGDTGNEWLNFS